MHAMAVVHVIVNMIMNMVVNMVVNEHGTVSLMTKSYQWSIWISNEHGVSCFRPSRF
jgi:hypothetical protein